MKAAIQKQITELLRTDNVELDFDYVIQDYNANYYFTKTLIAHVSAHEETITPCIHILGLKKEGLRHTLFLYIRLRERHGESIQEFENRFHGGRAAERFTVFVFECNNVLTVIR